MRFDELLSSFNITADLDGVVPYGNGHINRTYLVKCKGENKYILQMINSSVFHDPPRLMNNIEKVTKHILSKPEGKTLVIRRTKTDELFHTDENKRNWRVYDYINNSVCIERPENAKQFYQIATAYASFVRDLADFDASALYSSIPDFHNTPLRLASLCEAAQRDTAKRAKSVQSEIKLLTERCDFYSISNGVGMPKRVTHNDTKSNNALLCRDSGKPLCVIDLDTVMPGLVINDFGDSIRFGASCAAEDESDLTKVRLDMDMYLAYTRGFLDTCGKMLQKSEILHLADGALLMTLECAIRFLTDYLNGDTYFKTNYEEHNLIRARAQIKLALDMEKNRIEMLNAVNSYIKDN